MITQNELNQTLQAISESMLENKNLLNGVRANPFLTNLNETSAILFLITALEKQEFIVSENNSPAIEVIAKNTFMLETLRGFALQGDFDTGKTFFAKKYLTILNLFRENSAFYFTAINISRFFKDEKMVTPKGESQEIEMLYKYKIIIVDDIGTEPSEVQSFGTKLQPIGELIQQRYDMNRAIWFTTNLSFDSMAKTYGERVTSRLKEMSYGVIFKGKDLYRGR